MSLCVKIVLGVRDMHSDPQRIVNFYDRFGSKQDSQGFYEDAALDDLVGAGGFEQAHSILEVGCGTGKFAARLLKNILGHDAHYVGIDVSSTMVALARGRLSPWKDRATIHHSSGDLDFSSLGGPFDRVIFTYVFDLFSDDQTRAALGAAHSVLRPQGRLCAAGLTVGETMLSRIASATWSLAHRVAPYAVGGCRPVRLIDFLSQAQWRVLHRKVVVSLLIPSEVIVAEAV